MSTQCCNWLDCGEQFISAALLASHVRSKHLDPNSRELAVCLWEGCKVYNRPSINQSWLARHVATHTKERPFKCLIEACAASFSTRDGLTRHMPLHFGDTPGSNTSPSGGNGNGNSKSSGNYKPKPKYRPGVQYVQQSVHARQWRWGYVEQLVKCQNSDAPVAHTARGSFSNPFDGDVMLTVQNAAASAELERLGICDSVTEGRESIGDLSDSDVDDGGTTVTLTGSVQGKRTDESSGQVSVLVAWDPVGVCEDEWLPEGEYPYTRIVSKPWGHSMAPARASSPSSTGLSGLLYNASVSRRKCRRKVSGPY